MIVRKDVSENPPPVLGFTLMVGEDKTILLWNSIISLSRCSGFPRIS